LLVREGKDPIETKRAQRAATAQAEAKRLTFEEAAEAYLRKFEDGWKNAKHRMQWRSSLREYILPALGRLDVAAIDTADVLRVLEPIWSTKPETASRVRGRTHRFVGAGRTQDRQFERARRNAVHSAQLAHEGADFGVGQCGEVADRARLVARRKLVFQMALPPGGIQASPAGEVEHALDAGPQNINAPGRI
jgi:hypothetical protein